MKRGIKFCILLFLCVGIAALASEDLNTSALSRYIMAVVNDDLGQVDEAIRLYRQALDAEDLSAIHLNLASAYIKKNDIPKAVNELEDSVRLNPDAVEPHAILALLYSLQNQKDKATVEYESALKAAVMQEPKNVDIYKGLGAVYLKQNKFKEAESAYKLITNLAPDDAEAHFYLGSIYSELKDEKASEAELKKAIELDPDYHEALNFLGYVYVEDNRNLNDAEKLIRKAVALDPENGAYIDSLGWLYFQRGKYNDALKELEKASALINDPVIFDHLGDAYLKLNNSAKAQVNWNKSLELDPSQETVKEKLKKLAK